MYNQIHFSMLLILMFPLSLSLQSTQTQPISSNSVLVALLDSRYTELSELIEKALLLPSLESAVLTQNLTFFAPDNAALRRDLTTEFRQFLLEPRNLQTLQKLLLSHIFLGNNVKSNNERAGLGDFGENGGNSNEKVELEDFQGNGENNKERFDLLGDFEQIVKNGDLGQVNTLSNSLSNEIIDLSEFGTVVNPFDVVRPDGVIHGISKMRIPKIITDEFNSRRSLRAISAIKPEGAPEVDPRTHRLKKPVSVPVGSAPILPIYDAMAPGPSPAPAPAPGPGGGHRHFDGEAQVKDFIQTLVHYGGYNELADILVNLTSLSTEMGRLVSEGYVLTVLAPNDEAMAKLTTDRLSEPGAPEEIVYYHIIPEYQTEESMYNSVRRFGKVRYDTLRLPHKVTAEEADGSVKFGFGDGSAYLFDPDIYTDGRISVQGIDGVLFPFEETKTTPLVKEGKSVKVVKKARRGKLLEIACGLLGAVGHDSHFTSCQ